MDTDDWTFGLSMNGEVVFTEAGEQSIRGIADRLQESLERPVTPYSVAIGLTITAHKGKETEMEELETCVDWVLDRVGAEPGPIPFDEVQSVKMLDKLPPLSYPRIRILKDGNEISNETSIDAVPHLQKAAYRLQKKTELPVEYHHVLVALSAFLDPGDYYLGVDIDLSSDHNDELFARVLRNMHKELGRLMPAVYGDEEPDSE